MHRGVRRSGTPLSIQLLVLGNAELAGPAVHIRSTRAGKRRTRKLARDMSPFVE
jgi:hypothetical protein